MIKKKAAGQVHWSYESINLKPSFLLVTVLVFCQILCLSLVNKWSKTRDWSIKGERARNERERWKLSEGRKSYTGWINISVRSEAQINKKRCKAEQLKKRLGSRRWRKRKWRTSKRRGVKKYVEEGKKKIYPKRNKEKEGWGKKNHGELLKKRYKAKHLQRRRRRGKAKQGKAGRVSVGNPAAVRGRDAVPRPGRVGLNSESFRPQSPSSHHVRRRAQDGGRRAPAEGGGEARRGRGGAAGGEGLAQYGCKQTLLNFTARSKWLSRGDHELGVMVG